MKKQRNWALLADYFDRSLIRNKLALSLGSSSVFADGLKWTPSGQHVEVWLNDDYVGVYLLTEDIRIDPARLNLKKMSSNPAANEVDGGYIVEVDFRLDCYKGADLDLQLVTPQGVPFCIDTPDEEAITPAQLAYIKSLLVEVENDLYGPNRLDRINPASFVDWYLLQELFRNNDAIFISSDFMWKDTAAAANPKDRLLNMGPLWDFDRSAGNVNYNDNWKTEGCWVSKPYQPNWFSRLFDNPDFLALTLSRWKQKRPALEAFVNVSIDTYARRLAVAAAAQLPALADLRRAAHQLLRVLEPRRGGRVRPALPERADGVARQGLRESGGIQCAVQVGRVAGGSVRWRSRSAAPAAHGAGRGAACARSASCSSRRAGSRRALPSPRRRPPSSTTTAATATTS